MSIYHLLVSLILQSQTTASSLSSSSMASKPVSDNAGYSTIRTIESESGVKHGNLRLKDDESSSRKPAEGPSFISFSQQRLSELLSADQSVTSMSQSQSKHEQENSEIESEVRPTGRDVKVDHLIQGDSTNFHLTVYWSLS